MEFVKYAEHVGLDQFGINWVKNVIAAQAKKEEIKTEEVEHIIDFLASDAAPNRIVKMSYEQAKAGAEKWMKTQIKKGAAIKELPSDTKTLLDFGDGFKVVKLVGENAYKREGFLMGHCVAGYYGRDVEVYSLRDEKNMPHCTMEKDRQIKGKGNGDIHPRYVGYVVKFLEKIGMRVGDSEMAHLGYVNIQGIEDKNAVFNDLYNEKYFYKRNKILDKKGQEYQSISLWEKFGLFSLDAKLNIIWKFDIAISIKTFISNLTAKLKKNKIESNTGDYSTASNTGDRSAASNTGDRSAASNTGDRSAASNTGNCSLASNTGHRSAASNTGDYSAASTTGHRSAASTTGDYSAAFNTGDYSTAFNTGNCSLASNTGHRSAASNTGDYSAAFNTGHFSAASNTGNYSAASNTGNYSAASNTGNYSAASNTGNFSAASNTGDYSAAFNTGHFSAAIVIGCGSKSESSGKNSIAVAIGHSCKAKAKIGNWLVLAERDSDTWEILTVKTAKVDGKILKEDVFYKLQAGEFVEVVE